MSTAVVANTLRTLHRMHRQLADLRDRLEAGPRQLAACRHAVSEAEAKLAAQEERVTAAKLAADGKQLQLRTAEGKIRDLEGKLNTCKTNREYQTLQDQIAADRMATRVLEDEILECLERVDAERAKSPLAKQALEAAVSHLTNKEREVAAERIEIEADLARVEAGLTETETELPVQTKSQYARIVRSKAAEGLAGVDDENCGGCYQKITGNMLSELMLGRPVTCRSCGRMLYANEAMLIRRDA